jgi:hypothetical protein
VTWGRGRTADVLVWNGGQRTRRAPQARKTLSDSSPFVSKFPLYTIQPTPCTPNPGSNACPPATVGPSSREGGGAAAISAGFLQASASAPRRGSAVCRARKWPRAGRQRARRASRRPHGRVRASGSSPAPTGPTRPAAPPSNPPQLAQVDRMARGLAVNARTALQRRQVRWFLCTCRACEATGQLSPRQDLAPTLHAPLQGLWGQAGGC